MTFLLETVGEQSVCTRTNEFRRTGGETGRSAGLKIQKSPILSGYLSLKADHDFHR